MAFYSACNPVFCPCKSNKLSDCRDMDTTNLVPLGKMIKIEIKPTYAEGELYGDNKVAESKKMFVSAEVTLETTHLPKDAFKKIFGASYTNASKQYVDRDVDDAKYGTLSFVYGELVDGVTTYVACLLHRVKFNLPDETFETTNGSITFGTPTITGTAIVDSDGQWRSRAEESSLANAITLATRMAKRESATLATLSDNSIDIVIDSEREELLTVASLLSSENVPSGTYAEEAALNQDAVSLTYQNKAYKITGDLDELEAYTINGVSGKWIGVIVGTGTENITSVSMNGTRFTAADVSAAQEVGAQDGEFLLWLNAAELVNDSQTIALSTATAGSDMTFIFEDVENDDESE